MIIDPTITTTTGAASACGIVLRDGGRVVSMFSSGPWYRMLRGLADLFIADQITLTDMQDIAGGYAQAVSDSNDPAAWHLLNVMVSVADEAWLDDDELRARLREQAP
jgi:hypothetical protein